MLIRHLVPPSFFIRKIFRRKLQIDQENSNYFMRSGNTLFSHPGDATVAGEKPQKTSAKIKRDLLNCFHEITGLLWPLLSKHVIIITCFNAKRIALITNKKTIPIHDKKQKKNIRV